MEERYPYIQLVTGASRGIAGGIAALVFLSGTMQACSAGGFAGFILFLFAFGISWAAYVGVMLALEFLRLLLKIEESTRELAGGRESGVAPAASRPAPAAPSVATATYPAPPPRDPRPSPDRTSFAAVSQPKPVPAPKPIPAAAPKPVVAAPKPATVVSKAPRAKSAPKKSAGE